jgi:hypothetical protein
MRTLITLAAIAAALTQSACFSMQQVSINDLSAGRATRVWVTHVDQSEILLNDAQVFRGNLVGFVEGKYRELPPADLSEIRVRKLSTPRTLALVAGTVAGFAVVGVIISGSEEHFDDCIGSDECDEMTSLRVRR